MAERDELDRYGIGRSLRIKLYMGSLSMVVTYGIIITWLFLRCVGQKDQLRIDWMADVRAQLDRELKKAEQRWGPQLERIEEDNEMLRQELDSLKMIRQ